MHYRHSQANIHLDYLERARYNLGKMFTPSKSNKQVAAEQTKAVDALISLTKGKI